MLMRHARALCLLFAALAPATCAQDLTHFVWALDSGLQVSPSPVFRVYSPEGVEVTTVAVPGSQQARGFDFDPDGNVYVCRGNQVRVLDRVGTDTNLILVPPPGTDKAQDVLAASQTQIWVSWGVAGATSRLCRYDVTGFPAGSLSPVDTFGPSLIDHPRRLTALPVPVPAQIFIANRGGSELLVFDTTTSIFTIASDLQAGMIGPIGLAYDVTQDPDGLWVAGDHGQAQLIGTVPSAPSPSPFTTVLNYGSGAVPGLDAPADLCFDRFRRLYIAGRSSNGATPGVYVFDASNPTTLTHLVTFPTSGPAPVNVIDVDVQPISGGICGPVDAAGDLIIETMVQHTYKFQAPDFPNAVYAAALSLPMPEVSFSPVFVPGVFSPFLGLLTPDPRALPFSCDAVFQLTAAVPSVGALSPLEVLNPGVPCPSLGPPFDNPLDIDLAISGFQGILDGNGEGTATIAYLGPTFLNFDLDGLVMNIAFLTFDASSTSGIGFISNPTRIVVKANPQGVVPCP